MSGILQERIILFDGACNLCNGFVRFVTRHDKRRNLHFAPLQSAIGQEMLNRFALSRPGTDSVIFIEKGTAYVKSTASLRIARWLGGLYPLLFVFIIIPPFIRDWIYNVIARNRRRLSITSPSDGEGCSGYGD